MNYSTLRLIVVLLVVSGGQPALAQTSDALSRGIRLFEQKNYSEARSQLEAYARRNPGNAIAAFYVGRAYLEERKADAAAEWLEKAARLDPDKAEHHLYLVAAYASRIQHLNALRQASLARRIKSHLDRVVELDPESIQARLGLIQYYLTVPGLLGGSTARAREQAEVVRRLSPYYGLQASVMLHTAEKNWAAIEQDYRTAIARYPDSTSVYYNMGLWLARQEQYERSLDALETVIRREPANMNAHYQIGRIGAISGLRLDMAERSLRRYVQDISSHGGPPRASAHWRLGMVLEKQGRKEQAREEYEAALNLDPNHREARNALNRVKS